MAPDVELAVPLRWAITPLRMHHDNHGTMLSRGFQDNMDTRTRLSTHHVSELRETRVAIFTVPPHRLHFD